MGTYLTRNELAAKLHVKPLTITRYVKQSKLPEPISFGQKRLFREDDVDRLLAKLALADNDE